MIERKHLGLLRICIVALLFSALSAIAQAQEEDIFQIEPQVRPPYTVNPGDILSIVVWKEQDLQRQVIVRPDGAFSFPLVGNIQTDGKSVSQIETIVRDRLQRFIPDPVVTIAVEQVLGHDVYVIGQVQRPGKFVLGTRVDVIQALSLAGGMTTFAKLDDIKILRRIDGQLMAIPFDYGDIEKGKRLHQNILLEPGDVVVVP